MVETSAPGPDGQVSLGLSVGISCYLVRSAQLVIAQVNPDLPYTFGAGQIRMDEIDLLVDGTSPPVAIQDAIRSPSTAVAAIANDVAKLVPDGATLQIGTGNILDACVRALSGHKELHIHSGLITEPIIDLTKSGSVVGPIYAAEIMDTPRMRAFVHENPMVVMAPAAFTHGAATLASIHKFVALLTTLELDLLGACNSEIIRGQLLSAPGGAPDFAAGAASTETSMLIIALESTARHGTESTIVQTIQAPGRVTLPGYLADAVVTEFGTARLRGASIRDRANQLISIAHPDFRSRLKAAADLHPAARQIRT